MRLALVRHGEAAPDAATPDWDLSARGLRQARLTGERLAGDGITHILSSPLLRALATAHAIAEALDHRTVEVWPDLRECFDKDYRGAGAAALAARFPRAALPADTPVDGWLYAGDTHDLLTARCRRVLDALMMRFGAGERVLVVSHGGFVNGLLHAILHIPPQAPIWFDLAHCGLTTVRFVPEQDREEWPLYPPCEADILGMNDAAHLARLD